jgi:hypothetical protein
MLAEVTYEEVLEYCCDGVSVANRPEVGLWPETVARALAAITQVGWQIIYERGTRPVVGTYRFPAWRVAAVIEKAPCIQHYVAVQGDLVHDPLLALPCVQAAYPNRGWSVHAIIQPTDPAFLPEHRARRRARILRDLSLALLPTPGRW